VATPPTSRAAAASAARMTRPRVVAGHQRLVDRVVGVVRPGGWPGVFAVGGRWIGPVAASAVPVGPVGGAGPVASGGAVRGDPPRTAVAAATTVRLSSSARVSSACRAARARP
jgi:hypothetical protein